jgi:hypothetical protein
MRKVREIIRKKKINNNSKKSYKKTKNIEFLLKAKQKLENDLYKLRFQLEQFKKNKKIQENINESIKQKEKKLELINNKLTKNLEKLDKIDKRIKELFNKNKFNKKK